jgi:hypothetical protein
MAHGHVACHLPDCSYRTGHLKAAAFLNNMRAMGVRGKASCLTGKLRSFGDRFSVCHIEYSTPVSYIIGRYSSSFVGARFLDAKREGDGEAPPPPPAPRAELELELIQAQMAQKPVLRGEVGARALRVRSVSRGEVFAKSLPRSSNRMCVLCWVGRRESYGEGLRVKCGTEARSHRTRNT